MNRHGVLVRGARMISWLRVAWFRVRLAVARQQSTLALALGWRLPVVGGLAIAAASVAVDAFLLPAIGVVPPCLMSTQVAPVFTAVASLSGLVALAVTVSVGPLESALGRFPAAVGAPLLEDEPRDGLLSLLLATFTMALGLLVVTVLGLVNPYSGVLVVALCAVATLVALIAYVKQRIRLHYPTNLARHLADQMSRWLGAASRRPRKDPGVEVTAELQRRHSASFDLIQAICRTLLEDGQQAEAGEVLVVLASIVFDYTARRRRLAPESAWFPTREVAVEEYDPAVTPLFERLALGPARRTERDLLWFEREVASTWEELLAVAAEQHAH